MDALDYFGFSLISSDDGMSSMMNRFVDWNIPQNALTIVLSFYNDFGFYYYADVVFVDNGNAIVVT